MGTLTYQNIGTPAPVSRMGGSKQYILIAPYDDFQTLQAPNAAATNVADRYKITTAHVMKAGKGFIKMYVTPDTGKYMNEAIGGRDRKSFMGKGEFYHPGEGDEIIAFQNQAIHDRFIILFPLPGSTELIQIGSEEFQALITPAYDTTNNSGDGRGTLFSFECFMPAIIKYTAATVPMLGAGA
ncbi:hypothetical protein F5984_20550 [Rudanella paleaurantiibacter]|uniref:Uncharacterized protein n=1 Tax=Rudanella paleaurantiibacter TaxID=2614655 RepID=A0A7J5TVF7_9BACT|nr:hypothetical protein [Rudanella paleaurantiibacter]KAB7728138.1 hypothetical protein F5984_20550 [Rudanella paleaurantiibacter]